MNDAQLQTLNAELGRPEYAGLSAAAVAARLNEATVTATYARMTNERTLIDELGETGETILQKLEVCPMPIVKRAVRWLAPDQQGVDLGAASTRGMIDQLTAGGVLTADEAAALKGMSERQVSWFEAHGLPALHEGDIQAIMEAAQ